MVSSERVQDTLGRRLCWLILAGGLLVRLVYAGYVCYVMVPAGSARLDVDGDDTIAMNILERGEFSYTPGVAMAEREPLYPVLLFLLHKYVGPWPILGVLLNVILGTLGCWLVYLLAEKIFDPFAAVVSLAVTCFYPEWVYYTGVMYREPLQTAILAAWLWLWARNGGEASVLPHAFMGVFFGALALARAALIPLGAVFLVLVAWRLPKKAWLKAMVPFLLSSALIQAPWVARNWRLLGRPVLGASLGGQFMYLSLLKDYSRPEVPLEEPLSLKTDPVIREAAERGLSPSRAEHLYYGASWRIFRREPGRFWTAFAFKVYKLWRPFPYAGHEYGHSYDTLKLIGLVSNLWLYAFALLGAFWALHARRSVSFLLATPAVATVIYGLFWSATRYRAPLMVCVIPLAAYAVVKAAHDAGILPGEAIE